MTAPTRHIREAMNGTAPVARCVLPLHLAPMVNDLQRTNRWRLEAIREQTFLKMLSQIGRRKRPLEGRPRVVLTRHSSKKPDRDSAYGAKLPLDCLKANQRGLGWIADDSDAHIELELRWEKAAPTRGQVVVEVFA